MQHKARLFLLDIVDGGNELLGLVKGSSKDQFVSDRQLVLASERLIYIVAEAVIQAAKFEPECKDKISGFNQIVGLRNMLAHAYFNADSSRLYDLFDEDIPLLIKEVQLLIDEP